MPVPARPLLRSAGTLFLALSIGTAGCDPEDQPDTGPRVLQLDSGQLQLPDSVHMAVVQLDRSWPADLEPEHVELRVGDIVRFESLDAAAHALAFDGTQLEPEARRFLEATGQLRSPPLLSAGNAWVVSFAHAPPGEYPYICTTHGAAGRITVRPR